MAEVATAAMAMCTSRGFLPVDDACSSMAFSRFSHFFQFVHSTHGYRIVVDILVIAHTRIQTEYESNGATKSKARRIKKTHKHKSTIHNESARPLSAKYTLSQCLWRLVLFHLALRHFISYIFFHAYDCVTVSCTQRMSVSLCDHLILLVLRREFF